jgi:hypothetical protein
MKFSCALLILVTLVLIAAPVTAAPSSVALGAGFYDDDCPLLSYFSTSGVWYDGLSASGYAGTYHQANVAYARSEFSVTFWGSGIALYGARWVNGDDAVEVYIDDVLYIANFYNATSVWGVRILDVRGLGYGEHELHFLQYTLSNSMVIIDAIQIYPASLLQPTQITSELNTIISTPAVTVVDANAMTPLSYRIDANVDDGDGNLQNVAFDYQISAGDVAISLVVMASFFIVLFLTIRGGGKV